MAGAPNNPEGGFFGGDILKRFFSFFLALVLSFSFLASPLSARAVVNPSFIYSAMYSFLLSTGYQFASSGSSSETISMMGDLYDEYVSDTSGPAVSSYYDYISLSQLGQYVFGYPIVSELQTFANWIKTKFSLSDNASTYTSVVSLGSSDPAMEGVTSYSLADYSTLPAFQADYYSMPVYGYTDYLQFTFTSGNYDFRYTFSNFTNGAILLFDRSNDANRGYFSITSRTPPASFDVKVEQKRTNNSTFNTSAEYTYSCTDSPVTYYTYNNESLPVYHYRNANSYLTGGFDAVMYNIADGYISVSDPQPTRELAFVAMYGSSAANVASSLALKIGTSIIDRASDITQDQSLVVDVGLSAGADEEDATAAVGSGIASGTLSDAIPATSVVADAVIDTPVQPYPDVDSLGLPELGLALTTRFPFSIPWDISAIYSALSAPSEPPVKTFDLIPASVMARWGINANTSITIDLTEQKYSVLLAIIHWSCIVGFCLGLAVMTKRYVWTTGG